MKKLFFTFSFSFLLCFSLKSHASGEEIITLRDAAINTCKKKSWIHLIEKRECIKKVMAIETPKAIIIKLRSGERNCNGRVPFEIGAWANLVDINGVTLAKLYSDLNRRWQSQLINLNEKYELNNLFVRIVMSCVLTYELDVEILD